MPYRPVVLCVDDDPSVLEMTRRVLEANGFTVVTADGGHDALHIAAAFRLDAAVLDFSMPEMDGAALAAALRKSLPRLPIVFYTALPESLPPEVLGVADAFVPKGSTVGTLADVVHGLIERVGRRAATRHPFSTPLIVRAHRPGVSTAASSGRSFDLSETGIGGELDSPLLPGQVVAMSIQLQHAAERVNAAARVAYRNGLRHGFQFLALSASQRALLRSALAQRGPASN